MSNQYSHGRGGVGNFGPDPTKYADAEIVRAGPTGDQGGSFLLALFLPSLTYADGPFSTGRGGDGNIGAKGSPRVAAVDKDVVPAAAQRFEKLESHHVGRGGAGNESHVHHHAKEGGHEEGLADKLKHKILGERVNRA
jgi:Protein of unknown function (DUF3602)